MPKLPNQAITLLAEEILRRLGKGLPETVPSEAFRPELGGVHDLFAPVMDMRFLYRNPQAPRKDLIPSGLEKMPTKLSELRSVQTPFAGRKHPEFEQKPSFIPGWKEAPTLPGMEPGPAPRERTEPEKLIVSAMNKVVENAARGYKPTYISPFAKSKFQKPLEMEDLRGETAQYFLRDAAVDPSASPEKLRSRARPSLASFLRQNTNILSGEPRHIGEKRRLAARESEVFAGDVPDPAIVKAREDLIRMGLMSRPKRQDVFSHNLSPEGELLSVSEAKGVPTAPSPEDVYLQKQEGEQLGMVRRMIDRLGEMLTSDKFLSDKQRTTLNMTYNLSGEQAEGMSMGSIAKATGMSKPSVQKNLNAALDKIKKTFAKEGLMLEKAKGPDLPGDTDVYPRGERKLLELFAKPTEYRSGGELKTRPANKIRVAEKADAERNPRTAFRGETAAQVSGPLDRMATERRPGAPGGLQDVNVRTSSVTEDIQGRKFKPEKVYSYVKDLEEIPTHKNKIGGAFPDIKIEREPYTLAQRIYEQRGQPAPAVDFGAGKVFSERDPYTRAFLEREGARDWETDILVRQLLSKLTNKEGVPLFPEDVLLPRQRQRVYLPEESAAFTGKATPPPALDTLAPVRRPSEEVLASQRLNEKPTRLVPDEAGDVEIGLGPAPFRYRRLKVDLRDYRDPETGKLERRLFDESGKPMPKRKSAPVPVEKPKVEPEKKKKKRKKV